MSHSRHQATGEFLELFYSRMFFPLITRPTRITAHKASLIDNIYTNNTLDHSTSGLFLNDISDHLPIFSIISGYKQNVEKNKYFTFRDKNPINIEKFKLELGNVDWADLPGYQAGVLIGADIQNIRSARTTMLAGKYRIRTK